MIDRTNTILICPDNDAEARMILMIAEKAEIPTVKSLKPHGGRLDVEVDEVKKIKTEKTKEVLIVELPGLEKEEELRQMGLNVKIIDHHTYRDFDRLTNPETGEKNKSSLEQFLTIANITDEEIASFGFDPKIVRGIGYIDALWINGLIVNGYSPVEMNSTLDFADELRKKVNPEYEKSLEEAKIAFDKRYEKGGYVVVESDSQIVDVRVVISYLIAREVLGNKPRIISVWGGDKISVENIGSDVVQNLKQNIVGDTFTFGTGTCWAVNNRGQDKKVTLEEIFNVLGV